MRYAATSTAAGTDRRPRVAVEVDGDAGAARVVDQRAELVEPRRRRERNLLVVAEHTDGHAQLVERLLAELLDRGQRRRGLLRMTFEHVQGGTRLHVDRGDAVGDHVVEVAGDAQAFLGDAAPGFLLAGLLEVASALLELGEVRPAAEVRGAEEHRAADPAGEGEEVDEVLARVLADQRERQEQERSSPTTAVHVRRRSPRWAIVYSGTSGARYTGPPAKFATV